MPLDAVTVSALTRELRERIEGGRIDKVQQPERDMLLISLRAKGDNLRLVIAAGTGNARACTSPPAGLKTLPSRRCSACSCASTLSARAY